MPQIAQRNAALDVEVAQSDHRAVQVDRRIVARLPEQRDHSLRLAQRIAADEVGALGKRRNRAQQPRDFVSRPGVLEDRQAEGRFGDEQIAFDQLEGLRRAVVEPLVVARDDDALAVMLEQYLR